MFESPKATMASQMKGRRSTNELKMQSGTKPAGRRSWCIPIPSTSTLQRLMTGAGPLPVVEPCQYRTLSINRSGSL